MRFAALAQLLHFGMAAAAASAHESKPRNFGVDQNGSALYGMHQVAYGHGGVPSRFDSSNGTDTNGMGRPSIRSPRAALRVLLNERDTCQLGSKDCKGSDSCCKGEKCCSYGYCVDETRICCPSGGCDADKNCCGQSNCSPKGGDCCRDESSCEAGNKCFEFSGKGFMCCTNAQCTAHVAGGTTIYASMGTKTEVSTASGTPAGQTTGQDGGTFVPTATAVLQATITASSAPVSYPTVGNNSSNNMGTIIGAVVGGVGGLIVISLLVFCSMRYRRHHDETAPPSQYTGGQSRRTSRTNATRLSSAHAELNGSFDPTSPQTTLAPDSFHRQSPRSKMANRYTGSMRSGGSDGVTLAGTYVPPMAPVAESPVLGKGHMYSPALSAHTNGSPMASVMESPVLGVSQLAPAHHRNSQHSHQFSVKSNIERPSAARTNSHHSTPVRARSAHFESPPLPNPTMPASMPSPITNRDPAIGPAGRVQKRPCEVPADTSDYHRGQMHELE